MQITSRFVFSLVACALLGGCAGVSSTRIVGDTVGAAGGALLGKTLRKGSSLTTALGAGGGLLLSETLQVGSPSAGSGPHGPTDQFPSVWVGPNGPELVEGHLPREEVLRRGASCKTPSRVHQKTLPSLTASSSGGKFGGFWKSLRGI